MTTLTILVAALGGIALVIGLGLALRGGSSVEQRITLFIEAPSAGPRAPRDAPSAAVAMIRQTLNNLFVVLDTPGTRRRLIAADWKITATEYWLIRIGVALLALMIGLLVARSIVPAVGLAILAYIVPGFLLFRGVQSRQKQFQAQLIDGLTLIRGAIAAGYSFQQSLNVVIQEMAPPMSSEFRQVRRELELGVPLSRALENMAARMESDDFNMVVTVVLTNLQLGGNLTTILQIVMQTIRERIALFSEIRALTAYANFASYLLTLLPFVTLVILAIMSPVYWRQLLSPGATRVVLIYAACSLVVGNILLRRIGKLNV